MATIYDVAAKAGVSIGTVSRFLNRSGYVGQQSRAKIAAAIDELGYSPNGVARSLMTKRTRMLGFIVSDLTNPFTPEVARGVQDVADESGYCTLIYNTDGDGQREVRALTLLRERQADGLIITPPETEEGNTCILEMHALGIPIVLLSRELQPAVVDRVTTDTYGGAIMAVQHLIALGHSRVAFIGGAPTVAAGRRRGYLDGLRQAGIQPDPGLIVETSLNREGGASVIIQLLELHNPPTGVFIANDTVALGAIQEALRHGYAIPGDLSVVGFDDIALAAFAHPSLTTIAQPKPLLGRTAVELLLARIEQRADPAPREVRLQCALVRRESTAPIKPTAVPAQERR